MLDLFVGIPWLVTAGNDRKLASKSSQSFEKKISSILLEDAWARKLDHERLRYVNDRSIKEKPVQLWNHSEWTFILELPFLSDEMKTSLKSPPRTKDH